MSVTAPAPVPATSSPALAEVALRRRGDAMRWLRATRDIAASIIVVLLLWEGLIRLFDVQPYIFPAPTSVLRSLWLGIAGGRYLAALGVTLSEVLIGAVIGTAGGLVVGMIMISSRLINRLVYPWIVAIQTIPKVAIAPLMLVWFGFGIESKIFIVALTSMFPVMVNTIAGLSAAEPDQIALIQALSGSRWQVLRYVQLPAALPYIFAGLNTAVVLAVIAAIVGEFLAARAGIGYLLLQANFALDLAAVFALLTVLGVLGVVLSLCVRVIENRVCFWHRRSAT
jgi:NitT/TauT family transport system permease protein